MKEFETLTQDKARRIIKEFKRGIEGILMDKFVELILFGSYARGDYGFGSDIDILIVVKEKLNKEEKENLSNMASKVSLKYDTVISYFEYFYKDFATDETPFLMNVRREGLRI